MNIYTYHNISFSSDKIFVVEKFQSDKGIREQLITAQKYSYYWSMAEKYPSGWVEIIRDNGNLIMGLKSNE